MRGGVLGFVGRRAAEAAVVRRLPRLVVVWVLLVAGAAGSEPGVARAFSPTLPMRVRLTGRVQSIPGSFWGLSVEVSELLDYVREGAVFDRAISLLRPASGGPLQFRVGGKSADDAYWNASTWGAPPWVFALGDDWLGQLAALARRDRLRVTLAVNLAVHSPLMAASFASAADRALAPAGLAGLAIGNEPDLFAGQPGLEAERVADSVPMPVGWTRDYSASTYRRDYRVYAQALADAVPGVPLAGPETARSASEWLDVLTPLGPLRPRWLTVHRYPLSLCWAQASPFFPRIPSLLSERSSAVLAARLRGAIAFAHNAGVPLRVSEINSVSCGGNAGVADSFATALWAPDVLFELMRAKVDGVNWHIRRELINAPFRLLPGAIEPLPELYGLALFAQMLGPEPRRAEASVSASAGLHVKVWAVTSRNGLSVLLINKGPRAARASLCCGTARETAHLERLLAPSITARSGVTLGGRSIGPDGRWHGRELTTAIRPSGRRYHILLPGYSAALVRAAKL